MTTDTEPGRMRKEILNRLEDKNALPPLPDILIRLDEMLSDPGITISDLAKLIEMEPVMAGRLMKWANGALYGGREEVRTLNLAIARLGLYLVRDLVYSMALPRLFIGSKVINHRQFWKHSLAVAFLAKALSRKIGASEEEQDLAYISGLMHDLGLLVFATLIPEEYAQFLNDTLQAQKNLETQEETELGIAHPELGAIFIAKWWNMPFPVALAVKQHHLPFNQGQPLPQGSLLVSVANLICNSQKILNGVECFKDGFSEDAWFKLGLPLDDVPGIIQEVETALMEAEDLLGG